eukprot:TRINITY_DN93755_c0_g1_i1.p1 TRINITY_DN93755_c0_g1~~TRINITY_DN93755_c0_g1_i1.p1  ORF type:complete len:465 (-),score=28.16 TRINITY_DN93755_c0_g1_i1:268-1626(-)
MGQPFSLPRDVLAITGQYFNPVRLALLREVCTDVASTVEGVSLHLLLKELNLMKMSPFATDQCLKVLCQWSPPLRTVKLGNCTRLTDAGIGYLPTDNLRFLDMSTCTALTDASLSKLCENATNLEVLNINNCTDITGNGLVTLAARCPELKIVNACDVAINARQLVGLAPLCPNLAEIALNCTSVTDVAVNELTEKCPKLMSISLCECKGIANSWLHPTCDTLQYVSLAYCFRTNGSIIDQLTQQCEQLQHIDLSQCRMIDDDSIMYIAQRCPFLKTLKVTAVYLITDDAIDTLTKGCKELEVLCIGECTGLTPAAVVSIGVNCTAALWKLDISALNVTDEGLQALAHSAFAGTLRQLYSSQLTRASAESISEVARNCPELEYWTLTGCLSLTDEVVGLIKECCPKITMLNVTKCPKLTVNDPATKPKPHSNNIFVSGNFHVSAKTSTLRVY